MTTFISPAMTFAYERASPLDASPVGNGATPKKIELQNSPENIPASMSEIILLDTLRYVDETLQHHPAPAGDGDAIHVRKKLKVLVGQAEKELTRPGRSMTESDADTLAILQSANGMQQLLKKLTGSGKDIAVQKSPALRFEDGGELTAAELIQAAQQQDPAALCSMGDRLATAGRHAQAIMLYMAADMKQVDQTGMTYVAQASKSLLALGHASEAKEGLTLALNQSRKYRGGGLSPEIRAEMEHLLQQAAATVVERRAVLEAQKFSSDDRMNGTGFDIDSLLCELGKIQTETSQQRVDSQQSAIKANRDVRDRQVTQKLQAIDDGIKAKAAREAAEGKMSLWQKVSKCLGIAVAVLGIALAPFTGGASLLATAFMAVDLGLELGEYITGAKMSIQSGIQIVCEKLVDAIANGSGSEASRKFIAGIIGAVVNILIMVVLVAVTMGGGTPKLFKAFGGVAKIFDGTGKTGKAGTAVAKVSMGVQGAAGAAGGATGIIGGKFGVDTADAGFALASADVQRVEIEKLQTQLDKLFEQYTADLKLVSKELQSDMSLLAKIQWGNIENRKKNIDTLFHRTRLAA